MDIKRRQVIYETGALTQANEIQNAPDLHMATFYTTANKDTNNSAFQANHPPPPIAPTPLSTPSPPVQPPQKRLQAPTPADPRPQQTK